MTASCLPGPPLPCYARYPRKIAQARVCAVSKALPAAAARNASGRIGIPVPPRAEATKPFRVVVCVQPTLQTQT